MRRSKASPQLYPLEKPSEVDELFVPGTYAAYHPSLSDVIDREAEIAAYEMSQKLHRAALAIRTLGIGLFGCLSGVMILAGQWVLVAVFAAAMTAVGLWNPKRPVGLPMSQAIIPFSAWENKNLLLMQPWDDFLAWCVCPSCGYVDAHRFRQHSEQWADVVRVCSVCSREWAQA